MSDSNIIDIVLSADDRYAPYAAVVMVSALENAHEPSRFRFHMLTTGFGEDVKDGLQGVVARYGAEIMFSIVSPCEIDSLASGRFGIAALLRLYMQDYLPPDCKRVIYLDCDVLVMEDLAILWGEALGDNIIAAGMDLCGASISRRRKNSESYFNSGVLLVDLVAWRDERVSEKSVEYLKAFNDSQYPDQDALNHVLEGRWKRLAVKWNFQPTAYAAMEKRYSHLDGYFEEMEAAVISPAIVHFIGRVKPWHPECAHPLAADFIRYSLDTPWPINAHQLRENLPWEKRIRLWFKRPKQIRRRNLTKDL
ncbi:glycosyltransferase family 8 protein [Onishia niordana]|uniref:glycosyltransferase family 8 protein n=1 Tax=Onishia niordana TaxID=2508711 RepID=UPI0010A01F25|nr:glycosyltransferase family 8 protein [Halomonas niordiana]